MLRLASLSVAFALALASPVLASEGVLPVRAGDRVSGTVRYCGDRHVLAVELVKGETFKAKVRVGGALVDDIAVHLFDPTGLSLNTDHVRGHGSVAKVGPFRATVSGTHLIQVTTYTRHEVPYDVTTQVRSKKRRKVRLAEGRDRTVVAPAGSILRVRGLDEGATIVLGVPGEEPRALDADGVSIRALRGDGLTLPLGGTYTLRAAEGAGRPRVLVLAPADHTRREVAFPELPDDRTSVSTWYDDTGWVDDPRLRAPADYEPPTSVPGGGSGPGDPIDGRTLTQAPSAPATADARTVFGTEEPLGGHLSGLGMPIAPIPTIETAVGEGRLEPFGDGPSYVYETTVDGIGGVTYRVQFLVGGRAALAPLTLDGRTSMRWWVEGDGVFHEEAWTLTVDPDRGVEVLNGSATFIGPRFETVQSSAVAYTLPTDGRDASGSVSWAVSSPQDGNFARTETFDGLGGVGVQLR